MEVTTKIEAPAGVEMTKLLSQGTEEGCRGSPKPIGRGRHLSTIHLKSKYRNFYKMRTKNVSQEMRP